MRMARLVFAFFLSLFSVSAMASDWTRLSAAGAVAPVHAVPAIEWRDTVGPGERSPKVSEVREILDAYGLAPRDPIDVYRFDPELAAATRSLQSRLGFEPDGIVTPALMDRLLGDGARAGALIASAAAAGPVDFPKTSVRVSIAARELSFVREGREVLRSRVIIGAPAHPTPEFSTSITAVTFNPPWNVPEGIKGRKIVPHMKEDPSYLARNHIEIIDPVSGRVLTRDEAMTDPMRYRYRQIPGSFNSLGFMKLEMPNSHTVYLHDTPERELFESEDLRRSSGCVRVEKISELAQALLGRELWQKERVDERLAAGGTFRVSLPNPVPVILYYRTAEPYGNGVRVNGDPYNRLSASLR